MALKALSLEQALETIVATALALMESNRELVRFLHVHALLSTAEAQVVYSKVLKGFYDGLSEVIEHFKSLGEIRAEVSAPESAQIIVQQIMVHFIVREMFDPRDGQEPAYRRQLIDILLLGIGSDGVRARRATTN